MSEKRSKKTFVFESFEKKRKYSYGNCTLEVTLNPPPDISIQYWFSCPYIYTHDSFDQFRTIKSRMFCISNYLTFGSLVSKRENNKNNGL